MAKAYHNWNKDSEGYAAARRRPQHPQHCKPYVVCSGYDARGGPHHTCTYGKGWKSGRLTDKNFPATCLCGLDWMGDTRGQKSSPKAKDSKPSKEEEDTYNLCCNKDGSMDAEGKAFFLKRWPESTMLQQAASTAKEEAPHKVVYKLQNKLCAQQGELDRAFNRIENLEQQLEAAKDKAATISNNIKETKEEISKAEDLAVEARVDAKSGSSSPAGFSEKDFAVVRDIPGAPELWESLQRLTHQFQQMVQGAKPPSKPAEPAPDGEAGAAHDPEQLEANDSETGDKDAAMPDAASNVEKAKRALEAKKKSEEEEKQKAAKRRREQITKEVEDRANKLAAEKKEGTSGP